MAQEFASDNSKAGLFSRLKLSNHRGFFSFIFVTLSIIFILITFAAVQQQQTTRTKASEPVNICAGVSCGGINVGESGDHCVGKDRCVGTINCPVSDYKRNICCTVKTGTCNRKAGALYNNCTVNCSKYNSGEDSDTRCDQDGCCSWSAGSCIANGITKYCINLNINQCNAFLDKCIISGTSCIEKGSLPIIIPRVEPACAPDGTKFVIGRDDPTIRCCSGLAAVPVPNSVPLAVKCPSSTQPPAGGGTTTLEEKCRSYGLGPNGDVTCAAKAAQNNVECKWVPTSGSTTAGNCVPGSVSSTNICENINLRYEGEGRRLRCVDLVNTCDWNSNNNICVIKSISSPGRPGPGPGTGTGTGTGGVGATKITCTDFTSQNTCLPADQCTWITGRGSNAGKQICQRVCGRIPDQPICDKRNDCKWKDNACTTKTGGGGDEATSSAELNLKLSFQGIVTLPKTKTELKVKVKLVDAENKEKEKDASTFTADANGIWSGKVSFEGVDLSQKYYLLIKGPMHVQKKICKADAADPNPGYYSCQFGNITLNSGSNDFDFSQVKMLVGDLPSPGQNGIVDREDTGIVLNSLLLPVDQRQSAETLDKSDLNLDGIVSTQDWSLMLEALKIKYDEK